MEFLYLLGLGFLLGYIFKPSQPTDATPTQNQNLNDQWTQFIAAYHKIVKTKAEKKLIEKMLQDLREQGMQVPTVGDMKTAHLSAQEQAHVQSSAITNSAELDSLNFLEQERQQKAQVQLDNASILLYFGAFLFVASVGLFVAFGGLSGSLRTLAVALVAIVMYSAGIWLFHNKPKLEQAGVAFAGIGLATAPFVGLAAYNFIFEQTLGGVVWFMTSLVCMSLYLHALVVLKKPLLNYVLIFTMLSLVESGISIVNAPLYYFGWGLAATGILLALFARRSSFGETFRDASYTSANLFMPIASASSVIMVSNQGTGQLGVSMILAAAFYATEFLYGRTSDKPVNAVVSQTAGNVAVGALAYAYKPEFWFVAQSLLVANLLQVAVVAARSRITELWSNFGTMILGFGIIATVLSFEKPGLVLLNLLILVVSAILLWRKQERSDAYIVAVIGWMILPLVFGQAYLNPHIDLSGQVALSLAALLLQWAVMLAAKPIGIAWAPTANTLYLLSSVSVVVVAWMASPAIFFATMLAIALSMVLLAEHQDDYSWASAAGIVAALPIVQGIDNENWFLVSVLTALVVNIGIVLRYRQETTRWVGTLIWLLLPLALGEGILGHWTAAEYAWAYLVAMFGLVFARAIARGVVFVSSKVPMASYAQSASISYVLGYSFAASVAVVVSLGSSTSRLHTSLILAIVMVVVAWLARYVEKAPDLLAILPLLAQALLLSVIRIDPSNHLFDAYLLSSTVLAAMGYFLTAGSSTGQKFWKQASAAVRDGSLIMAALAPVSFAFAGETKLMMPVGLLVFTALLYHRMRTTTQGGKEWIGALGLVAIWWLMWFYGVRNVQAYSHVLAALFAIYAYRRHLRGETDTSDQYLVGMLASATVPLILQALSGTAGDVYGWWLLLEQIFFMILGMTIGKSLVTRWGLYVAVGAVLYQLRHLGWAALTVLAIFIIGLAVYRLQKQDTK